ncbi:jg1411, partial [Pararge aegeria aegeria]
LINLIIYTILQSEEEPEQKTSQSYQHSSASRKAEVEISGAHSTENRWTFGFQGAGMTTPHR